MYLFVKVIRTNSGKCKYSLIRGKRQKSEKKRIPLFIYRVYSLAKPFQAFHIFLGEGAHLSDDYDCESLLLASSRGYLSCWKTKWQYLRHPMSQL